MTVTLAAPTTKASQPMTLSDKIVTQDVKVVDVAEVVLAEVPSSTVTAVESEGKKSLMVKFVAQNIDTLKVIPRSKLLMAGVLPKVVLSSPMSKPVKLLLRPRLRKTVKPLRPPLRRSQKTTVSLTPITSLN